MLTLWSSGHVPSYMATNCGIWCGQMVLKVKWIDQVLHIITDECASPVMLNGLPANNSNPSWQANFAISDLHPLVILFWTDLTGREAVWFLDSQFNYIANDINDLKKSGWPHLTECAVVLASRFRNAILLGHRSVEQDFMSHMLLLDGEIISGLLTLAPDSLVPVCRTIEIGNIGSDHDELIGGNCQLRFQNIDSILHIFSLTAIRIANEVAERGRFVVPSLFSSDLVDCNLGLILSDNVFAYRFVEPTNGYAWFAIASFYTSQLCGIYLPDQNLLLVPNVETRQFLVSVFPGMPIEVSLQNHLIPHARDLIASEIKNRARRISYIWHNKHLGHHIWQDLTGAYLVNRDIAAANIPDIVIVGGDQAEMWGRLDELFPTFAGKVTRGLSNLSEAASFCYRQGLIAISPTSAFIPQALSGLIVEHSIKSESCVEDFYALDVARSAGSIIVLLGLRVENRTVVNFKDFCLNIVDQLSKLSNRVTVVVDGHNQERGASRALSSFADQYAIRAPIDVEKEIVVALLQKFDGTNVSIIDLIGQPMARSVFWSVKSDFFVTPWGAGLAKYRWVANSNGLVLAGARFLDDRIGLDIYNSNVTMENSGPVLFIDRESVEDDFEDRALISIQVGPQARDNYKVSMDGVVRALRQLIEHTASSPKSSDERC